MVERFFSSANQVRHGGINPTSESAPITLLSGPPSCGKTSLLLQYAFNSAFHLGGTVVFLCIRPRLHSHPPFLSQGIDPSSDIFQRIQMKYVEDEEGIKEYFAAFHLHPTFPVAVVIDDFGDFFHERSCQERYGNARGRDLAMVRVLALCRNAICHANKRACCELLLSDTHRGDSPRLLFIYKRWTSSIFTIKGDGSSSFLLKNSFRVNGSGTEKTRAARYSIALQYLVLEEMIDAAD